MLGFGTVVLLAVVLLNGYVWWRLVRSTTRPGRTRRLLTLVMVLLALLPVGAVLLVIAMLAAFSSTPID